MAVSTGRGVAHRTWQTVGAASIGNALEWFDLLIYGYLAVTISRLFFPSNDEAVSLLLALGTFGASYLVRPLGALVLGTYADRACWLSLLKTAYSGVLPSLMAELFPTRTRGTGIALSYNISVPIFGGFAPFFAALLIQLTGDRHAPSFYLMLTALISLAALIAVRSRFHLK